MFRKNPTRPVATRSSVLPDIELKDDELEHVVGGLERGWATPHAGHRGAQVRVFDESSRASSELL
ncbi:MAG: hypothetical protein F4X13_02415 [Gammaproteobacteria bacterium]|nr:hypothetical protein [Gammaproteobacteria bacterium]